MSFLVVTAMGMMAVSATMNDEVQNVTQFEDHADGETATTSAITASPQQISGGESTSSSEAKTNVILNGKPVAGSSGSNYSETITTDNGTMRLEVSSNTGSTGSGFNSSMSTTHTNISSNSFTNDVHIHTSP